MSGCAGCSCPLDEYTQGCRTCNARRYWHRRKAGTPFERQLSVKYHAQHQRVRRTRGPARDHQCVRCPAQAAEWAQVHTEDGSDIWADYVPLCRGCHRSYDGKGHQVPETTKAKVREFASARPRVGGRWI